MVRDVAYVNIPGNRDEVLKTLQKRRVSGVPVVKKGAVVGMITRSDLLRNREEDQIAMLMTRDPIVVGPQDSIIDAAKLLVDNDIRRLPVVEGQKLAGMITVADLVRVASELDITTAIDGFFQRKVLALWGETPLPVAGAVMELAQANACPVLDSATRLVGMISDRDLINASTIEDSVGRTDMSDAREEDGWMWDSIMNTVSRYYAVSRIELKNIKVAEAMVPAITAIKSSTVSECAATMRKKDIDQLPVVTSGQKLMGLLHDSDIVRALIAHCA